MPKLDLRADRTAILCMDYQTGIVAGIGDDVADNILPLAAKTLDAARSAGIMVIYIHVGFRDGFPEISQNNAMFSALANDPLRQKMFEPSMTDIHPAVAPNDGDIVITKRRVSAFYGTELDIVLRAGGIDTLIMFGIATSGVVLSTLTDAIDADYRVTVIKDLCADSDVKLHTALLDFYAKRGDVITADGSIDHLR